MQKTEKHIRSGFARWHRGRRLSQVRFRLRRAFLQITVDCSVIAKTLPHVLRSFRPDLVFYDAGVDPHESDVLGRLSLTDDGLYRREMMVHA